jgi:DNA-directed RNA polymerase specialized sigma24 family protein
MRVKVSAAMPSRQEEDKTPSRARLEGELQSLFESEAKRIVRALYAYTHDRDIASDAMSEAFAQALASQSPLRSPRHWVWSVAFRIAAGQLKEMHERQALLPELYYEMDPPGTLIDALAKLSTNQRAALILRHYAGYSTREISRIIGCQPSTVRVHLSQGRRRLLRLLEEDSDE